MVNGIVSAELGYYRVGEATPWEQILNDVADASRLAFADMEVCEVGAVSGQIPVTTLGSKSLRRLMRVVYKVSKLTALLLFPFVLLVTVLSLVFLV
jgi:predicted neutral ceramidase superfamily lipid hydrolase